MKIIGVLFLTLSIYGVFAAYRVIKYKELYWMYPNVRYRKKGGYSNTACYLAGIGSIPAILITLYTHLSCCSRDSENYLLPRLRNK
jgi:hypothetical protein